MHMQQSHGTIGFETIQNDQAIIGKHNSIFVHFITFLAHAWKNMAAVSRSTKVSDDIFYCLAERQYKRWVKLPLNST